VALSLSVTINTSVDNMCDQIINLITHGYLICLVLRYFFLFSNNFLKIDIYYGQLKYEEIEQKEAYDVVSFFSK